MYGSQKQKNSNEAKDPNVKEEQDLQKENNSAGGGDIIDLISTGNENVIREIFGNDGNNGSNKKKNELSEEPHEEDTDTNRAVRLRPRTHIKRKKDSPINNEELLINPPKKKIINDTSEKKTAKKDLIFEDDDLFDISGIEQPGSVMDMNEDGNNDNDLSEDSYEEDNDTNRAVRLRPGMKINKNEKRLINTPKKKTAKKDLIFEDDDLLNMSGIEYSGSEMNLNEIDEGKNLIKEMDHPKKSNKKRNVIKEKDPKKIVKNRNLIIKNDSEDGTYYDPDEYYFTPIKLPGLFSNTNLHEEEKEEEEKRPIYELDENYRDQDIETVGKRRLVKKKKTKEDEIEDPDERAAYRGARADVRNNLHNFDFELEKLPKRNKAGGVKQFFTNLAIGMGKWFGRGLNWIGAQFARLFSKDYRRRYRNSAANVTDNDRIQQESRNHDRIPGWNGAEFEKDPNGEDDILADFRRIPTVWSRLTAKQAEDSEGEPLPPIITVYIRQSQEGVDKTLTGMDSGHTGMGIEYSRKSLRTGQYERYNLRYGFFPAGEDRYHASSLNRTGSVVIPGQLKDESANNYTVRRSFPATPKQVNDILKASETYPDQGYNSYTRNCTSFVRDMFRIARIPAGEKIFEREAPGFSPLVNAAIFAGRSSEFTARTGMEGRFEEMGGQEDLSYGGDGNMRVTKQDYRNYKRSLENNTYITTGDFPNAAAENIRRLEGANAGQLGSRDYYGSAEPDNFLPKKSSGLSGGGPGPIPTLENTQSIRNAITAEADQLISKIVQVSGKRSEAELLDDKSVQKDLRRIIPQIRKYADPLNLNDETTRQELRAARSKMDQQISDMNQLLALFHNDARLHIPILHMISLLEWGNEYIDTEYEGYAMDEMGDGDMNHLRQTFLLDSKVKYEYRNPDRNDVQHPKITREIKISPSKYEAYLQIKKNPKDAIETYDEYVKLRDNKHRTKAQQERYKKLARLDDLADDYVKSHEYMIQKEKYSQQDIDYAFSLGKREKDKNIKPGIGMFKNNTTAADIYKSLILDKIFGGFGERYKEVSYEMATERANRSKFTKWLDDDLTACVNQKSDEMIKVIKGLKKSMKDADADTVVEEILDTIGSNWRKQLNDDILEKQDGNKQDQSTKEHLEVVFVEIIGRKDSELRKIVTDLTQKVFNEEEGNNEILIG